jgi:hypothetical protein
MKKIFLFILIVCLFFTIFLPYLAKAKVDPGCKGLVPCGCKDPIIQKVNNKDVCTNCCEISDFFVMLARVYDFIVKMIAAPIAVLMLSLGAVFMLISAGNQNLQSTGRTMIKAAVIGLILVLGSWILVNFIMTTLGVSPNWNIINF